MMRSTIIGFLMSCGLLAAAIAPAAACQAYDSATSEQKAPPQTADAQTPPPVETTTQ